MFRTALPFLFLCVLAGLIGCGEPDSHVVSVPASEAGSTQEKTVTRKGVPDFELPALDGSMVRLSSLQGTPVVLNFWATWCAPCRAEMPEFEQIHLERGSMRVRFVGVSIDEEGWPAIRTFLRSTPVSYPILLADSSTMAAYGQVPVVPATWVLDRDGNVRQRFMGQVDFETLSVVLDGLDSETDLNPVP